MEVENTDVKKEFEDNKEEDAKKSNFRKLESDVGDRNKMLDNNNVEVGGNAKKGDATTIGREDGSKTRDKEVRTTNSIH